VAGADPQGRTGQSSPEAAHLLRMACNAALGLAPALSIYGRDYDTPDGTCVRDYIHVSDLAAAHLEAARHLEAGGSSVTLNCGYGRGASVLEVVQAVERVTGRPLPRQDAPRRPGDAPHVVADVSAIGRTLPGWTPRFAELDRIVADALRWERRRLRPERVAG
jgi:UDP-glucose 4-epimerase